MPKKTIETGWRVIIEPRRIGDLGYVQCSDSLLTRDEEDRRKEYLRRCEEIIQDIRRHVDNVGHVHIDIDTEDVCQFCERPWTEDSTEFNAGCCEKDMEHEPYEAQ